MAGHLSMSSSSFKSDSTTSSSSDDSLMMSKQLLDELMIDEHSSSQATYGIVPTIATQVLIKLSQVLVNKKRPHGGSIPGRRYIQRDRKALHDLIMKDYFSGENSKYTPEHFWRRFRMDINLFQHILEKIGKFDDYFIQKIDAARKLGLSPLQKMIAAIRMLAYGCPADILDEYIQIGEITSIESLFCDAIITVFEEQYQRKPYESDIQILMKESEARGFPGMLGSLDCMHWHWKNCPTAWHGTHTSGFKKVPTLILEVVASQSLWIWHAFFGMASSNNDINVLDRSPLFDDLMNEVAPSCEFVVQGHHYKMGYYLLDGIYPQYATLIQTISQPTSPKEKLFAKQHESVRMDVERAFGVLQARWHIVKGPARFCSSEDLGKIMKTCIILHNMIIESEQSHGINPENWQPLREESNNNVNLERDFTLLVSRMISRMKQVQDKRIHQDLKADLINHLSDVYGDHQAT